MIFYFSATKHAFGVNPIGFDVNPRDADYRDLKLASGGARTTIGSELLLPKQLIC